MKTISTFTYQNISKKRKKTFILGCSFLILSSLFHMKCEAHSENESETHASLQQAALLDSRRSREATGRLSVTHQYSNIPGYPVLRQISGANLIPSHANNGTSVSFAKFISSLPFRFAFSYRTCTSRLNEGDGISVSLGKNPDNYALLNSLPMQTQGALYNGEGISIHFDVSGHIYVRDGLGNVLAEYTDEQVHTGCDRWQKIKVRLHKNEKDLIVLRGSQILIRYQLSDTQLYEIEHQPIAFGAFSSSQGDYRVGGFKIKSLQLAALPDFAQRNYTSFRYPIPRDIQDLFVLTHDNQAASDKVVLVIQGGPSPFLSHGLPESRSIHNIENVEPSFYLFADAGFSIANVHQINTLGYEGLAIANDSLLHDPERLEELEREIQELDRESQEVFNSIGSPEFLQLLEQFQAHVEEFEQRQIRIQEAEREELDEYLPSIVGKGIAFQNAEIIVRVIKYFRSQNKKVYLIGSSYGAMLLQFMLIHYPDIVDSVEGISIVVGRLQLRDEILANLRESRGFSFRVNSDTQQFEPEYSNRVASAFNARIAYTAFRPNYITEFSRLNFPRNTICYIVADRDLAIGPLSSAEESFARRAFQFTKLTVDEADGLGAPHDAYIYNDTINIVLDFYLRRGAQCDRGEVSIKVPEWVPLASQPEN